jgi:hypothetical protein
MLPLPSFPKFPFSIWFYVQFLCISYFFRLFSVQPSTLTTELTCINVHTEIPRSHICVTLPDFQKCLMFRWTEPEDTEATCAINSICSVAWCQTHVHVGLFCYWTSHAMITCKAEKSVWILTLNISPLMHNGYCIYHLLWNKKKRCILPT